jgi:3',5'-cyclic-AMP phosphodiesterase
VSAPFLLVQLSDPHAGAEWGGGDPAAALAAAVDAVLALRPDAVLVSGDLADHAADGEYEQVRALLAPLGVPVHVLPGNHDDRAALRRHFGAPGAGAEPVRYAIRCGPLRLVACDTSRPGRDDGELDVAWVEAQLDADRETPTLLALHHPPLLTGLHAMDACGLAAPDRRALGELVARHPQVRCIAAGHAHRTATGRLGGCPVLLAPSTYVQARLDFETTEMALAAEPPGFVVHALLDGELVSHVQPV